MLMHAYTHMHMLIHTYTHMHIHSCIQASITKFSSRPGDFNWDPLGIRPADEAKLNELQTKELKNGRLAMLSTAGMAYQTYVTGQGPWEQLTSGHISPFGDGQGFF